MGKNLRFAIIFLVAALLVTAVPGAAAPAAAPATDPEGVIRAIFSALNAGDVKAATAYVAEDAVLVLLPPAIAAPNPNVIQKKAAITAWWTFLVEDKGHFELSSFRVEGNKVTWQAAMMGNTFTNLGLQEPLQNEGMAVVEKGLLQSYTWIVSSESMARVTAAAALAANKQAVRDWFTALEKGDQKGMDAVLAKDFVNHSPPLPKDRDGFIGAFVANYEMFPTGKYINQSVIAEGDQVFVFGHFDGAHTGSPFEGIKATGAKVSFDYSILFHMKDGKIADRWATADDVMGLLVPLGYKLVPPGK